jgi:hypothetical protein
MTNLRLSPEDLAAEAAAALFDDLILGPIAASVAAKFNRPPRDVLHFMREEFRAVRVRADAAMTEQARALPALVEEEIESTLAAKEL